MGSDLPSIKASFAYFERHLQSKFQTCGRKVIASATALNSATSMSVKLTPAAIAKLSTSTDPPVVPALSSFASATLSAMARVDQQLADAISKRGVNIARILNIE